MISDYDITVYDIIGVYHFFWFFLNFYAWKKIKVPLRVARTRTLVYRLQGSWSDHWTNGPLSCIPIKLLGLYTIFSWRSGMWVPPVQPPSASKASHVIWYHIKSWILFHMISYITMWYHRYFDDVIYDIIYRKLWHHIQNGYIIYDITYDKPVPGCAAWSSSRRKWPEG